MCIACFTIPTITIQLLLTSAALLYGQRSIATRIFGPQSKWTNRITFTISVVISLVLTILAIFLGVLATNDNFCQRNFANFCLKQSFKSVPLDEHRCGILQEGGVSGKVLEFGPGPGTNFKCFASNSTYANNIDTTKIEKYVAVEPNTFFEEEMKKEWDVRGLTFPLEFVGLKGEDVDINEADIGTFDTVIMTHVLCSVDSVQTVLANAESALKPGGRIIFMEHVLAHEEEIYMRSVQSVAAPILNIIGN